MSRDSRRRLALAVASVLAATPAVSFGIDRHWIERNGGQFELPSNWNPEGAPEATDVAIFDLRGAGYTVSFNGDATTSSLRVADTLTFELNGHAYNAGAGFQLAMGQNQSAHLTVRNGPLSSQGTNVIAGGQGSGASLTLAGGSSLNSVSGQLRVGQAGAGVFNIRESSDALLSSLVVGVGLTAGAPTPVNGSVNVSGLGSILTVSGATTIGESADGSVTVRDGARLATGAVTLGSQPFGRGALLLSGPDTIWQANNRIDVGPGSGTITAFDGARIQSIGGVRLGNTPSSLATVLLSGTNTIWSNTGTQFEVGAIGSASFTIAEGASLSLTSGSFGTITSGGSTTPAPSTTLRVTGAGSNLRATQGLAFPMFGRTNVIVEDGGSLSAMSFNFGTSPGPGTTNISIDGPGSIISLTQQLALNRQNISITNGGTLATPGANIATVSSDSAVIVRIAGHGSSWSSSSQGPFQVGQTNGGAAEIHLEDGGQLSAYSMNIVGNPTATALVSVSGEGSRLSILSGTGLQLGMSQQVNAAAELRVTNAGAVSVRAPIRVNTGGRLILDGGGNVTAVNAPPIDNFGLIINSGGTISGGTINNNGEILLRADDAIMSANQLVNNRLLHGSGRVSGNVTNNPPAEIRADAGDRLVFYHPTQIATVNNSGRITLMDGGAVELYNNLINTPTGIITFAGGGSLHGSSAPGTAVGPVQNAGQILFSAGTSDFFPALTNSALAGATSKVIVTGNGTATFHGPVAHTTGAEFRVSEGSTAVFFAAVTGAGEFTGTGAKFFEAGRSDVGALASGGETTVQAPASLSVSRFAENTLTVRGQTTVRTGRIRNTVNDLIIEGAGEMNLNDNDLVINSGAASRDAVLAKVKGYIASARNSPAGRWKGPGLTSAAAANTPLTTLGLGTSGHDDAVIVRYTYDGDATLDGRVDADDYFRIDSGFLGQPANPQFAEGDFNYDNMIDADDYFLIDSAFLGQGEPIPDSSAAALAAIAAVPEPGAAMLLAVGGLIAWWRRRR